MTGTAPSTHPLLPEDPHRLGPFALTARLGSGGMGVVYLGRHDDGRPAAVKVVHPHLIGDPDFRSRFGREIALAHRVDTPWTARVIDADAFAPRPWLATEYVAGPSLEEQVGRAGPLPASALDVLARRLAEALAGLHGAGVVHRDLKPSNVLLAADGPRLIDFGIASSVDATKITHTGHVVGTPAYMAPEQASGEAAGAASDVFSLASVLVFAATGRGPFGTAAHPAAMLLRVMQQDPDLHAVPAPLRDRLVPCFAREPADRPTAAQLAADRDPDEGRTRAASSPTAPTAGTSRPAATRISTSSVAPPPARAPRPWVVANAVLAVLVAAALALAFLWVPTSAAPTAAAVASRPDGVLPQVTEVAEIPLDAPTGGIAMTEDGRTLMVVTDGGVRFIDTATRSVSPAVPLPAGTSTLSFTPDGTRVYLVGPSVSVLDVRSRTVTGVIGQFPDSIRSTTSDTLIALDGRTAYVTFDGRTDLGIIDLTDGREIGAVPIGTVGGSLLRGDDGRLYVVRGEDPVDAGRDELGMVVVDPAARRVVGTLPGSAFDVAVDAAGDRAFVLQPLGGMTIVDAASATLLGPPVQGFPEGVSSLVVTPGGNAMVGWSWRDPVLHIADSTGVPRQDIDTGGKVNGAGLSPDGRRLYVSVEGERNGVLVYDTSVLVA
ncbi:protein kinase [Pseudonocardia sp. MH-G8]|uniref:protein kinase domain-containing protein n=1 Tax=Pseudonocardia sp. MH-G8 TaxID=1854588 RepID=UPI00117BD0C9|nr:protein kinase [Pseudonocardia sp. MH-G8]